MFLSFVIKENSFGFFFILYNSKNISVLTENKKASSTKGFGV